ncbi:IclR family transcriptional regulator [Aeromicrobium sp.]|uniref:IclR family transcriptional regulator n=1 Tax=Aeromicrobium sp. TaxID=1871063 RepID=UPI0030BCEAF6
MPTDSTNKVLQQASRALTAFAQQGPLTAPELAQVIGIPRPSGYRLLGALLQADFVTQAPDGKASLSTTWLQLGDAAIASMSSRFDSDDLLDDIREATGLTVYLCVLRGDHAVCVRQLHGANFQVLALKPGGNLPLNLGAVGRALLAFGPVDHDAFLAKAPFEKVTPFTLADAEALEADMATTRERGYALSDQDVTIGVGAIGVPVRDSDGTVLAALSVAGLRHQIIAGQHHLSTLLNGAADRMAERLLG